MNKKIWFKHYNTASESASIEALLAQGDHETVSCYWILLELISRLETENERGKMTVSLKLLSRKWHVSQPKVERILARLSVNFQSTFVCTLSTFQPTVASIFIVNWLELQENRGGKRESKKVQKMVEERREKKEVRSKEGNTTSEFTFPADMNPPLSSIANSANSEMLGKVSRKLQEQWILIYGNEEWIKRELGKAVAWTISKNKKYSNWGSFFNNWLNQANPPTRQISNETAPPVNYDTDFEYEGPVRK